ncbi:uncharacterized protein LOC119338495 [Triticum dicoccoides]|uniref:uncharacterized protein LOC119338495 n=1 Tax=Triticum dicoccoides TaxID=85692 RepID=UPI001891EC80|nr:uncharacterized protein LOC119338495 [Triticum dicoccoides]
MQVPQVTEEAALAVTSPYPTVLFLAKAYDMLDGDRHAQEEMLKNKSNMKKESAAADPIRIQPQPHHLTFAKPCPPAATASASAIKLRPLAGPLLLSSSRPRPPRGGLRAGLPFQIHLPCSLSACGAAPLPDDAGGSPGRGSAKKRGTGGGGTSVVRQLRALVAAQCIEVEGRLLRVVARRAVVLVDVHLPVAAWSGRQFRRSRSSAAAALFKIIFLGSTRPSEAMCRASPPRASAVEIID